MTVLVDAKDLGFDIDGFSILDGVSLQAGAGEVVAVVGPNSAGKSTLLALLAGDMKPVSGSISLAGTSVAGVSPGDLSLIRSFLRQHPPTGVPFTVREVVAMGRHPHRMDPANTPDVDAAAVDAALDATDVAHLADRIFATLSGGEEQRTNVARILAQQAPVALLDEPTTALDIGHQELLMASLRTVAGAGSAVVTVLHDLNLAASSADRMLLLHQGRTVAAGTPRQVLQEDPLSEVYGHPVRVIEHPFRDGPLVLPVDR